MIVIITAEAEADLEQIATYVAEQSPRSASLLDAPRGYPLVPRYEHLDIRRRPFGQFLIFYRVGQGAIEVIHILHGARDYESLLFPEK